MGIYLHLYVFIYVLPSVKKNLFEKLLVSKSADRY